MSNDDNIDFYAENDEDEEEEEINNSMGKYKDDKPKNIKKDKPNAANTLFDGDDEEEEINDRKKKKKKVKEKDIEILKELKEEDRKERKDKKDKEKEKEDDLNNSRDFGEDNEQNEPDFYAEEDDGDNEDADYQEHENQNEVKRKQKNIKKEVFDINYIYEINNKFHYNKDSPLFYILEKGKEFNYHPTPLSSKQLVKLIREENIPYDYLRIKLVDLFQFKSKLPFVYVELKEILKPNWSLDVDYSTIFKDLSKLKLNDNKINNNVKDEKDNSINVSSIKNENESFSFSLFKNTENDINKKEEKNSKKEDKKEDKKEIKKEGNNKINRNKKKGKKKGQDIVIKTGFVYDD